MQITVKVTKNYGNEAIYPVCETAQMFAQLVGKKTLSHADLRIIRSLGYEVKVEQIAIMV